MFAWWREKKSKQAKRKIDANKKVQHTEPFQNTSCTKQMKTAASRTPFRPPSGQTLMLVYRQDNATPPAPCPVAYSSNYAPLVFLARPWPAR